jgi:Zn-dependent protease with chaperone function
MFFGMIIIANILFIPIDKKYRLRSKYHNKLNKRFRGIIATCGLSLITVSVTIAFHSDDYFKSIGISRGIIEIIVMIPLLFILMILYNPIGKDAHSE